MIVSPPMVMSFEPTRDAVSEIAILGASEVGGLGAAGAVDARLVEDIIQVRPTRVEEVRVDSLI